MIEFFSPIELPPSVSLLQATLGCCSTATVNATRFTTKSNICLRMAYVGLLIRLSLLSYYLPLLLVKHVHSFKNHCVHSEHSTTSNLIMIRSKRQLWYYRRLGLHVAAARLVYRLVSLSRMPTSKEFFLVPVEPT